MKMERRFKKVVITEPDMINAGTDLFSKYLPIDIKYDIVRQYFDVILYHPDFPELKDGDEVPEGTALVTQFSV